MDPLATSLLDLLYELRDRNIPLLIGGGFGLYLKRDHLMQRGERRLLDRLPVTRSTNDIDLFLMVEVLADLERAQIIAEALAKLDYSALENAKFFQWRRAISFSGVPQEIRLDLLVGPIDQFKDRLKVKEHRVRPKGEVQLHAYLTEEAVEIEAEPIRITLAGRRSNGDRYEGTVLVPRAFPYLMMKLHAFDDRKNDVRKDVGRHHALDLYTIVGLMTEPEYEEALKSGDVHRDSGDPHVAKARQIVIDSFSELSAPGMIRLREHPLYRNDFELPAFMEVLREIFAP
jgi:hypothetical protein